MIKLIINRKKILKLAILLILVTLLSFGIKDYLRIKSQISGLEKIRSSKIEVERVDSKVKKYIDIPVDEVPEIRQVKEVDILEGQGFFKNARSGDMVLVYIKFGKGVLYRESQDKIIEFAPLNFNQ